MIINIRVTDPISEGDGKPMSANEVRAEITAHLSQIGIDSDEGIDEAGTLDQIVDVLDGQVWSPDTIDWIAAILRKAGYEIRDRL